ncbi:MAG: hypothetical protein SGJ26_09840, partial [Nitrospirota bacterium]|nr:hypothetical protein [Nitrospirota bacterium]
GREASSMRETSFVKRISFRSRALHVSHLLPALHASLSAAFHEERAVGRFRPSTVLGTLSFVEGRRTVMHHAG